MQIWKFKKKIEFVMLGDGVIGALSSGLNNNYANYDMDSLEDMLMKVNNCYNK